MGKKVFDIKIRYPKDAAFQPRCNISNDTDIELVCHHCGIPLAPSSKDFVKGFFRKNFFYKKKLLHLIKKANSEPKTTLIWQLKGFLNVFKNREFSGLDIHPDQAVHCKKCKHHHPSQTLNAIIITVVLLTFLVDQGMFVGVTGTLKLLIILFGFTLIIVNWRFFRKRDVRKFPILGRMPEIQVNEWINGSINLMKDGNYAAKIFGKGLGEIKFSTKITSNDERRLNDFKKTTSYKPIQRTYQQIAGFLLFQIARKINWIGNLSLTPKHVNKVLLKKPASFSNHLESFEFINKYNFELTPKEQFSLPIQIIPVILSEGGEQTALELTIQVNPEVTKSLSDADVSLVEFIINDPGLGYPQRTYPSTTNDENHNQLKWQQIRLNTNYISQKDEILSSVNEKELTGQNEAIPKVVFYVRFASPISTQTVLTGNLVILFNKTITGLDDVQLFSPLGYRVDPESMIVKKGTKINMNFELDFHSIQVKRPYTKTKEYGKNEPILKIPNYERVNNLVNLLSGKQDIYVQRVIENPPATNKATAMVLNRFWEISGRKYANGLFPIDFRIMMTGKETYARGNDEPVTGSLCFEITTNATIVGDFIDEADNVFEELCATVEQTIEDG